GYNILSITLIIVALIGLVVLYKERPKLSRLKLPYFLGLGMEALIYAVCLTFLLSTIVGFLFQVIPPATAGNLPFLDRVALSIGAGLYEELFFRVILLTGLIYLFKLFLNKPWLVYTSAILLAS